MSQKTDNLIKLALVFFVSLLSFSIGTYVGKKYSDNQHKLAVLEPKKEVASDLAAVAAEFDSEKEMPSPENVVAGENTPEAMLGQISTDKPAALTDAEVAQLAEEFASEEDSTPVAAEDSENVDVVGTVKPDEKTMANLAANKKITPSANLNVKQATPSTVAKPVTTTNTVTAQKNTNSEIQASPRDATPQDVTPQEEERQPASLPPRSASTTTAEITPVLYTVQIGSFPTEAEASEMTKNLQNKGYKTSYIPAKVNGQTWYRVNVGLFGTIREAQDYKKEFLGKTQMSSAIIQRVQN